jgi:hypothetical protein
MLTVLREPTKELQRFRSAPWQFQQTFVTPLKDLKCFVSTICGVHSLDRAVLTTDTVVFEPQDVIRFFASHSVTLENCYKFTVLAEGQDEIAELLEVVLSNWIDFLFVPTPQSFAIYADHDEYTTFYFSNHETLVEFVEKLREAGFKDIHDYKRGYLGVSWR